ncbi:MAG: hypothetical protein R2799_12030 [Crocinitomicaceae bacterium]
MAKIQEKRKYSPTKFFFYRLYLTAIIFVMILALFFLINVLNSFTHG